MSRNRGHQHVSLNLPDIGRDVRFTRRQPRALRTPQRAELRESWRTKALSETLHVEPRADCKIELVGLITLSQLYFFVKVFYMILVFLHRRSSSSAFVASHPL